MTMFSLLQMRDSSLMGRRRNKISFRSLATAFLFLMVVPLSSLAATIQDIEFNSLPGGKFQIKMEFDSVPPVPVGYNIERPARIALDFPGVQSALDKKKYTLSYGNAQSVVILESQDRSRMVINLVELAAYTTTVEGNSLLIEVGNDGVRDYFKEAAPTLSKRIQGGALSGLGVSHIDFQRGEFGEGNVVIELTDDNVEVDVRFEGSEIRVDFANAAVSENLQRQYDVRDFATPVDQFAVRQTDRGTTVSVKPMGDYDYLAYQTDNVYVLSVKPLTQEEVEEKRREFAYVGEKLSLNFQDIKVRSVLQLIADFTELNLVTSDSVDGSITLRLQNVPWDQALDLILKTKGLDKRQVGNVLMVAPAAEIAERERQEIETRQQLQELAPLQTEFIRIRYADALELFKLFDPEEGESGEGGSGATVSILSPRGSVVVDERTNSLLITDTAEKIDEFRRLIKNIDVPLRQVLVEARVVIANKSFEEEIGIAWGGGGVGEAFGGDILGVGGSVDTLTNPDSVFDDGPIIFPGANFVDFAADPTKNPASVALGVISDRFLLLAELSALEVTGNGEIISQPKVITGDKQEAEIKTGRELPFLEASASGRATVKFKEAVLSLKVKQSITPDDRLILDLKVKQDSGGEDFIAGELNSQIPIIEKNEVTTQVLVDNGETIVLGGIFQESEQTTITKVPVLGDIPYVGKLFRRTLEENSKRELLIFITPRILADKILD